MAEAERKIPEYKYLSREEILRYTLSGELRKAELITKAPIAYSFPACRFKRARMVKNEFIEAWEKLPDIEQRQKQEEEKIKVSS